jgi:hypothetical protein
VWMDFVIIVDPSVDLPECGFGIRKGWIVLKKSGLQQS